MLCFIKAEGLDIHKKEKKKQKDWCGLEELGSGNHSSTLKLAAPVPIYPFFTSVLFDAISWDNQQIKDVFNELCPSPCLASLSLKEYFGCQLPARWCSREISGASQESENLSILQIARATIRRRRIAEGGQELIGAREGKSDQVINEKSMCTSELTKTPERDMVENYCCKWKRKYRTQNTNNLWRKTKDTKTINV